MTGMQSSATLATDEEILANAACLRRLARHLVDPDAAADLVQDTWTAAFAHRPRSGDPPVRLWVMEVMRNFARMGRRKAAVADRRRQDVVDAATPAEAAAPDALLERLEASRALVDELSKLPDPYRATVLLRYFEDRTAASIAELQGVPAGTVRWRLNHALGLLRARLDARFGGRRRAWLVALSPLAGVDPRGGGGPLPGGLLATTKTKVIAGVGLVLLLSAGAVLLQRSGRPSGRPGARAGSTLTQPWATHLERFDPAEASPAVHAGSLDVDTVDTGGRPVTGARLALSRRLGPAGIELWDVPRPVAAAVSAGGRARFDQVPPGIYSITATSDQPGLASSVQENIEVLAGQVRRAQIVLGSNGFELSGRVLDSTSGVVAGGRVIAQLTERDGEAGAAAQLFTTTSGDDGTYRVVLAPGRYALRAEADGYAPGLDYVILGAAVTRDLVVDPGAALTGRIVDRLSRQPVPAASVQARLADGWNLGRSRPAVADATGAFRLAGLGPGDYVVDVRDGTRAGRSAVVRLGPGQAQDDVLIEIDAGRRVSGRVVGERGAGVERATIILAPVAGAGPATAVSDATGAFHFEGQLPGRYEIAARTADGRRAREYLAIADGDVTGVTLELVPQVVATGQVFGPAGPVEGARVTVILEASSGGRRSVSATTTADGRFRFTGLERGSLSVRAEKSDTGRGGWGPEPVAWGASREVSVRLASGASLTGQVRAEDGRPAPGAVVHADAQNQNERISLRAVAGPDGHFTIRGLDPGAWRITASREGGHMRFRPDIAPITLAANEDRQLDLVVPRRETVRGTVLLPDGTPAPGAVVIAGVGDYKPLTGSALRGVADDQGRFAIDDLDRDAIYTLWADLAGFSEAKLPGILAGNHQVVLDLAPESGVAGVVVDQHGRPATDFELVTSQALSLPGRRLLQAVHDPRGSFEVRPLPAGQFRLQARSPAGPTGEVSIKLAAGERRTDVRITLRELITVQGTVVADATGMPLAGVAVAAPQDGPAAGAAPPVLTDARGSFTLPAIAPAPTLVLTFRIADRSFLQDLEYVLLPSSARSLDIGTVRMVRGDMRDRIGDGPRGMTGIESARQGAEVVLSEIRPNTPAERAGLRTGDRLISVDGKTVDGLGLAGRSYLVAGKAGTPVTFVVQRAGEAPRRVALVREAFAPAPSQPAARPSDPAARPGARAADSRAARPR